MKRAPDITLQIKLTKAVWEFSPEGCDPDEAGTNVALFISEVQLLHCLQKA
jgi:hypothetical protein